MEFILQEINKHKTNLMTLINNLINTQLINEEIYINNEIKKENECLISLLNVKQNTLNNQININNNINPNSFMFQQNFMENPFPLNINPLQQQAIDNNLNNNEQNNRDNIWIINIKFVHTLGKATVVQSNLNEKISEIIKKYREKSNDYQDNFFFFNGRVLNPFLKLKEISTIIADVVVINVVSQCQIVNSNWKNSLLT